MKTQTLLLIGGAVALGAFLLKRSSPPVVNVMTAGPSYNPYAAPESLSGSVVVIDDDDDYGVFDYGTAYANPLYGGRRYGGHRGGGHRARGGHHGGHHH